MTNAHRVLIVMLFFWGAPVSAIEIAARDALTGAPVEARLSYEALEGSRSFALDGRLQKFAAPAARVNASAEARGYQTLSFTLEPSTRSMTLLLEPIERPARFVQMESQVNDQANIAWLQGYVRRAEDGEAVPDAWVLFEGQRVQTDESGYFEFGVLAATEGASPRATLRVQAPGIGDQEIPGLVLSAGIQRFVVALDRHGLVVDRTVIGALDVTAERQMDGEGDSLASLGGELPARAHDAMGVMVAPGIVPPASIRVGFADAACTQSCCTGNCTHVCTMPLETYVRRGLDNEWIASWNTQSLRAGSIAYRSYGAWRANNPIRSNFDICSNACCQVNNASTHSATDAAIARTPGIVLSRNGSQIASSEYSSENNSWKDPNSTLSCTNADLSCGNGFAGSPNTGWPCLADSVGTGKSCFGHGRGMSQWGTQRWAIAATAQRWPWIVDHYFNAHGTGSGLRTAVMTSPLVLSVIAAQPSSIVPGSNFQIMAQAHNHAGAVHPYVLMGASLYRSGVGYIDDSNNDEPLSLAPGSQALTRAFQVPAGTSPGSYDLLVSLYLDVDENGSISSADLPLALLRANGAVQITLPSTLIFVDGFE